MMLVKLQFLFINCVPISSGLATMSISLKSSSLLVESTFALTSSSVPHFVIRSGRLSAPVYACIVQQRAGQVFIDFPYCGQCFVEWRSAGG